MTASQIHRAHVLTTSSCEIHNTKHFQIIQIPSYAKARRIFPFQNIIFMVTLLVISYALIYDIGHSVILFSKHCSHSTVKRKPCSQEH